MNLALAQKFAIQKIAEHGLHSWIFKFDNSVKRFGVCDYRNKIIGLSRQLTELNDEEQVKDTIMHEIAHALVGISHGHDHVWKAKCREIGAKPERCYSLDNVKQPKMRWQAICEGCGTLFQRARRQPKFQISACACQKNMPWDKKIILKYTDTKRKL